MTTVFPSAYIPVIPSVVGNVAMRALRDTPPLARYPVGDDAKYVCEELVHQSDANIDSFVASTM